KPFCGKALRYSSRVVCCGECAEIGKRKNEFAAWHQAAAKNAKLEAIMKRIATSFLVAGLLATSPASADEKTDPAPKKAKPRFTISKESTYVTGPVDKDGYIDYQAALNDRLGKGVTPQNNANVLLWKALGPHPEGAKMPAEFFKRMGMVEPPEKG